MPTATLPAGSAPDGIVVLEGRQVSGTARSAGLKSGRRAS